MATHLRIWRGRGPGSASIWPGDSPTPPHVLKRVSGDQLEAWESWRGTQGDGKGAPGDRRRTPGDREGTPQVEMGAPRKMRGAHVN
jgi:hypothetical protein